MMFFMAFVDSLVLPVNRGRGTNNRVLAHQRVQPEQNSPDPLSKQKVKDTSIFSVLLEYAIAHTQHLYMQFGKPSRSVASHQRKQGS